MDLVRDALDSFNRVGKLAYGIDTEYEAISEGFIGKIFYKALNLPIKARPHLYNCLKLANTLYPKIVSEEAWF